jgi:hypothetical protein
VRQFREPLAVQPFKRLCVPVVAAHSGGPGQRDGGRSGGFSAVEVDSTGEAAAEAGEPSAVVLAASYSSELLEWLRERPHTLGELLRRIRAAAATANPTGSNSGSSSSSSISSWSSAGGRLVSQLPEVLACIPGVGCTSAATLARTPGRFVRADSSEEDSSGPSALRERTAPDPSDVYWAAS